MRCAPEIEVTFERETRFYLDILFAVVNSVPASNQIKAILLNICLAKSPGVPFLGVKG